jgi:hypothetical protein
LLRRNKERRPRFLFLFFKSRVLGQTAEEELLFKRSLHIPYNVDTTAPDRRTIANKNPKRKYFTRPCFRRTGRLRVHSFSSCKICECREEDVDETSEEVLQVAVLLWRFFFCGDNEEDDSEEAPVAGSAAGAEAGDWLHITRTVVVLSLLR